MERILVHFSANEQKLICSDPFRVSSYKVQYIEAHFDLGQNWSGFDSVRAVWWNDFATIGTVLDSLGVCRVPAEVLRRKGPVMVNLVGSISDGDVLTDRLTTYPVEAGVVDANAKIDGPDPHPATPSQVEQFAAAVREDADRAEQGATDAQTYAQNASNSATSASNSATAAHDDKIAIEEAIAEVIQQIEDFEQVQVVVNTLPPSSQATSDFTDGVLTLGIPQGVKGDTGNGIQSIAKTGTSGLVDTYRITYTDGQTTTFTVTNGAKGDTGNGIQSIAKTSTVGLVDTYTITYTNGTTTTFTVTNGEKGDKGDTGEVSLSQLYSILPTDTASGDIASFTDGADSVPMLSVVADIEPIQDLHGYDKPWSAGAGANKYDKAIAVDNSRFNTTGTGAVGGISRSDYIEISPNTSYYIMGVTPNNSGYSGVFWFDENKDFVRADGVNGATASTPVDLAVTSPSTAKYVGINMFTTNKDNGAVNYPSSVTTYSPYSNICPISGRTECVTEVCGKNIWGGLKMAQDIADIVPNSILDTARKIIQYEASKVSGKVLYDGFLPNTQYTIILHGDNSSATVKTPNLIVAYTDGTSANIQNFANNSAVFVTDPEKSVSAIKGVWATSTTILDYEQCGVFEGNLTADQFEPYINTSYTTALGQTVYGGTLDVVSGELVVTHANIASYAGETLPSTWICDRAVYAEGVTPPTGSQVVYELATPQTYQLTPTEVALLKGQNNVWTDSGEVEVTYKADVGLYIDKRLNG